MTEIDVVTCFLIPLSIFCIACGILGSLGRNGNLQYLWLLLIGILFGISSIMAISCREDSLIYTDRFETIQKEIRLHYPELRKPLYEAAKKNDHFGITVKEYHEFEKQMKIIDEEKLNCNGVEF